jgi:hypothetical protein
MLIRTTDKIINVLNIIYEIENYDEWLHCIVMKAAVD